MSGPEHVRARPWRTGAGECRPILPPRKEGWTQLAMGEWELVGSGFGDCHPHDEVTYVLAGELRVQTAQGSVVAAAGDVVRVPANEPAWYFAPEYARMLYIYGPNPSGQPAWTFDDPAQLSVSSPPSRVPRHGRSGP